MRPTFWTMAFWLSVPALAVFFVVGLLMAMRDPWGSLLTATALWIGLTYGRMRR